MEVCVCVLTTVFFVRSISLCSPLALQGRLQHHVGCVELFMLEPSSFLVKCHKVYYTQHTSHNASKQRNSDTGERKYIRFVSSDLKNVTILPILRNGHLSVPTIMHQ